MPNISIKSFTKSDGMIHFLLVRISSGAFWSQYLTTPPFVMSITLKLIQQFVLSARISKEMYVPEGALI